MNHLVLKRADQEEILCSFFTDCESIRKRLRHIHVVNTKAIQPIMNEVKSIGKLVYVLFTLLDDDHRNVLKKLYSSLVAFVNNRIPFMENLYLVVCFGQPANANTKKQKLTLIRC